MNEITNDQITIPKQLFESGYLSLFGVWLLVTGIYLVFGI
jgi:hypothetical protein